MSDSDQDDAFNFQSAIDFDAQQEEKENMISNDHHFKILTEICDSFYNDLQKNDYFSHKSGWRTYSNTEPINIEIKITEKLPGICDIIKPNGSFYHKVLTALGAIIIEVDNLLPNIGTTNYESLYGLSVYGEEIDTGEDEKDKINSNSEEEQISRMITYFYEIYEKIISLMGIAVNLINQLISLYGEQNNKNYQNAYKFYTFDLPFEYLGKILSYFLAIDTVVSNNEFLKDNWDKYRTMFHQCKNNSSEFNMNDDQKKKLDKLIKKLNAPIFEKTCYSQCVRNIIEKTGEISPSGNGLKPIAQCPIFFKHFAIYLGSKFKKIYDNLKKFTECYEPIEVFQYLSLFGFYLRLIGDKCDKNLLKAVWQFQKKITIIPIVGITVFKIEDFLNSFDEFRPISKDPSNITKHEKSELHSFCKSLPYLINNYKYNMMIWMTKIETTLNDSNNYSLDKKILSNKELLDNANAKIKLIIEGLSIANYFRKNICWVLYVHLDQGIEIKSDLIDSITSGLEIIKTIENEFKKLMPLISLNLNIMNRTLLNPIQEILKKVAERAQKKYRDGKSSNEQLYKDALSATAIFYSCSQAAQSELRLVIEKLCLNTISAKELMEEDQIELFNYNFWKLELLNQLSREIKRSCDCSFLYLYQTILPTAFKNIYSNSPKRLYYFALAVNDMEIPLTYIKFKENNGIETIKLLRKTVIKMLENSFLNKLCKEIETDLRVQIHRLFIEGLKSADYSEINLLEHLQVKIFPLFDTMINVKRYVEEYLNITFYNLTTLDLNNWQTYQQMRVLAKHKYGLNLHEIFLPNQNLQQGKDILDIIRNLQNFTNNYTHNLHSQVFIEIGKGKDSTYVNVIGVQQIINSLYTHGTGIINSLVNKSFKYISKIVQKLLAIIFDDYILSLLKDEKTFWNANKAQIKYNYPLDRAMNLRSKILSLDDNKKVSQISKLIQFITQIGNTVAITRCIRAALMDYNSQNVNLLTCSNINDFNQMSQQITLENEIDPTDPSTGNNISPNLLNNIQNSLNDSNKMFCETISSLKQTGENSINYLEILVSSFGDSLTKIPDIDLFIYLLPALTITFIDNAINAKDNLIKKNKTEEAAYFSDDGFMVGLCYLLKIFSADKKFESLNWFPSVISYYNEKQSLKQKKDKSSYGVDTLNERQINSYKEQFEFQYFTYSSAAILFSE